ncbi:MAG: hypothetical protein AAGL11_12745, partial [Pseudomonadota bacterium]
MTQIGLFTTHLQQTLLPSGTLLDELADAVWMIEDGDQAGHDWCEHEGYPGYTSYASLDDLPDRAPAFADLVTVETSKSVGEAMDALEAAVGGAGATVFARIDHQKGARSVDL